ncbi:hypothetical protein DdX_21436 [Ditylenchus destructor]|uniref:Uncharacterized protein n=1 Tax=Ditylenchus destructor TaxID=166010 RepID=A0AAD4MFQ2_9BILA|nr:hypothetical protein DdX_21436 [Ditylenchus destructor]
MEHTKESDVKPEYYHICNHLFILESRGGPAVESARTKANLALNGDDFHRTQDETFYHAVKSHCFTGIYLNVIPFSAELLESFHQFVIKPLAMDSGKRNYRVDEICFDRCSFILESTIQPFLRLLSQPLPLTKMYISQMFGVSSSTFLDSVLNSPALICTSRVILIMDCVFSSATFSDDDVVLAFIFGDNFNGACRQYFASLDQPNETLRQDFLLWDWQPGEKFLAKAIQKFFAKASLLYQTVLPVTKSVIRLPGSRMPNFVSSFLRNEFQNCLQEFNCAHDSSERDSYEFTEESNRKPARVKVDGRPYEFGIEQNVLTTEYTLRWKPSNGLGTVCMHILVNEDDERRKWPNLPHPICRIGPKFTHEIHVKFSDC